MTSHIPNRLEQKWRLRLGKVARLVGQTPLYDLSDFSNNSQVKIYAKLEWQQIGGSVKSRPAFNIIAEAIQSGVLRAGMRLLDATSGNTGIAYAAIGAAIGLPVTLCLPENASNERKQILTQLGAELILTSRFEGTDGAQNEAKTLADQFPSRYFYADQYKNEHNWRAHYTNTAPEILQQSQQQITHFVAGLGTTGTFTGVGRRLKKEVPTAKLVSLQPNTPMHGLEGWKHLETAIIPSIYDPQLADDQLEIDTFEAYKMLQAVAKYEGLLIGPSAAANLIGSIQVAESLDRGVVVTTFADDASKYSEALQKNAS